MRQEIQIENLKCGGCANTITKELSKIEKISALEIDVQHSTVIFETEDISSLEVVKQKLSSLGYPELGAKNSLKHKAKSYISCATGRIN